MASFTRLPSGSWRVQVRRKGEYVNESFLRRKDAEEWALEVQRRIARGEPILSGRAYETKTFGDLNRLHRHDLREVGKQIGRSKAASLAFLEHRLGSFRLPELDRERLIQFGKERASEGVGPVTLGMDLGYIKTIPAYAAAVHGAVVAIEPINLARVALGRLGLIGKGDERDRRPTQDELNRLLTKFDATTAMYAGAIGGVRWLCQGSVFPTARAHFMSREANRARSCRLKTRPIPFADAQAGTGFA